MAYKFNPFTGNLDEVGAGTSAFEVKGTVATVGDLPGGATQSDVYLVEADDNFYVWDGSAWSSLGTLAGPQGPTGATGAVGPAGADGSDGTNGTDGVGVDAGGATGQVLAKASGTDYDTEWVDQTGGGGTPGGSDTQVQFNDGGAFAGDSGLAYDDTAGALTVGGKTVTTDAPILNLSQTWNNAATTFTGLKLDVINTASAADSKLFDLQVNGSSKFDIDSAGNFGLGQSRIGTSATYFEFIYAGTTRGIAGVDDGAAMFKLPSSGFFGWAPSSTVPATADIELRRGSAGVVKITSGSTGTGYVKQDPVAVSALPAAATVGSGTRGFVNDANDTTFASVVAGGGANVVPVYSDGTSWRIG